MTQQNERLVHVVDDDPGARRDLALKLNAAGFAVRLHPSAEAFLATFRPETAGCILLDLRLEGMCGLDLLEHFAREHVHTPVVILTGHSDVPTAVRAMKLGAFDFLEKPCDPAVLVDCVHAALRRDSELARRAHELEELREKMERLTDTERVVFAHMAQGFTTTEIAARLHRSTRTVENHRHHILQKTHARSTGELIRIAVRLENEGLGPVPPHSADN